MNDLSRAAAGDLLFYARQYRALLRAADPAPVELIASVTRAIERAERELGYDQPHRPAN